MSVLPFVKVELILKYSILRNPSLACAILRSNMTHRMKSYDAAYRKECLGNEGRTFQQVATHTFLIIVYPYWCLCSCLLRAGPAITLWLRCSGSCGVPAGAAVARERWVSFTVVVSMRTFADNIFVYTKQGQLSVLTSKALMHNTVKVGKRFCCTITRR